MAPKRLAVAAAFAILIGCSESTGTVILPGVITFTYSGGMSGTYSATGSMPSSESAQETTEWSAAVVDVGFTSVLAVAPRNASSHDFFVLQIRRSSTGSEPFGDTCTSTCSDMVVTFGEANGASETFLQRCFLESGSVTITEISLARVKGTFSGTGTCIANTGTSTSFAVTAGTFDTPVLPSF